jgi:hypothetical protein
MNMAEQMPAQGNGNESRDEILRAPAELFM